MRSVRSALPLLLLSALGGGCGARSALECQGESCRDGGWLTPDEFGAPPLLAPDDQLDPSEFSPSRPEQLPSDTPIDSPIGRPIPGSPEPAARRLCAPGGTLRGSYAAVDAASLEALEGCAAIDGDLLISGSFGSDLAPLYALRRVTGTLAISIAGRLGGLEALDSVGALSLSQFDVPTLQPLSGVRLLGRSTGGALTILQGRGLRDLHGLGGMAAATITISDNASLETLDGLNVPSEVDAISIVRNPKLSDIAALSAIEKATLIDIEATAITTLDGLQNLTTITTLALVDDAELTDSSQLGRLESANVLYLDHLGLVSLRGPSSRLTLGTAVIQNNPNLVDVDALGAVALSELSVLDNPALERLPEFPAVTALERVDIGNNARLASGPLFGNATSAGTLSISQNPSLTQVIGFSAVEQARTIQISRNASLVEVNLGALTVTRRLDITCNPALPESSLEPLRELSGSVEISGNLGSPAPCDG